MGALLRQFSITQSVCEIKNVDNKILRQASAGQFDGANRDSRDFFSIHAGELEQSIGYLRAFSAETAAKAWPLFYVRTYDAFLVPPQDRFRGGVLETPFYLARAYRSHPLSVDPGSDTIARG
jgi:hypothetical protein